VKSNDRYRLEDLVTGPRTPPDILAAERADTLVDLVLDADQPWWRKVVCAKALRGRVPDSRAGELLAWIRDTPRLGEAKSALLDILAEPDRAHSAALLEWLRSESVDGWYDADVAILRARAALGDLDAVRPLTDLAADAWKHRREPAEAALAALADRQGLDTVVRALGAESPEALAFRAAEPSHRMLGVRLLWREDRNILPALADTSTIVARHAATLLGHDREFADDLRALAAGDGPDALWALVALHGRDEPVRERWEALGAPRVALPSVPADVREAILREYAPGQRETDPRWIVEAASLPPADPVDESALLRRATEALERAGLTPAAPVSAGDEHDQGEGTYHSIATTAGTVTVSTLGPFFRAESDDRRPVDALRDAGFRHIDPDLDGTRVEGLCVYWFGARTPLDVGDLLFHWQD
jgi:hypothetical protein